MPGRNFNANQYRYGMMGFEKDDEIKGNGNSIDLGDRIMYDPRLGRVPSPDKLQAKYPWISPYAFVANNPILNREIDGRDWTVSSFKDDKGNTIIKIVLDAVVLNSSATTSLDMQGLANAVKNQVQTSYSMTYKNDDGTITTVEAIANVRVIGNKADRATNEHLIEVLDNSHPIIGGDYGYGPFYGNQVYINADMVPNMINGNDNNTVPHELGHTAGLAHMDILEHLDWEQVIQGQYMPPCMPCVENNINNEMVSGGNPFMNDKTSTEVNKTQIEAMQANYGEGKLNQDKIGKVE